MTTQADGLTTRERILVTTAEHFRRYGYHGTGLKQIVGEAGAQLGSLYHFFPGGKEELAEESIRRAGAMYRDIVKAVFDASPDVVAGAGEVYRAAGVVLDETDYADACPVATVALEVASTNERLRRATADVFASWIDEATEHLANGGVADERARGVAIALISLLEGAFVLARAAKSTEPLDVAAQAATSLVKAAMDR
jgi:AcrR family transcriptional regulator